MKIYYLLNFDNDQGLLNLNLMKAQIKIINFTLATKINIFPIEDGSHIADSILLYKLHYKGINYMDLEMIKIKIFCL